MGWYKFSEFCHCTFTSGVVLVMRFNASSSPPRYRLVDRVVCWHFCYLQNATDVLFYSTYMMCRIRYVSSNDVLDSIVVEKQQTSLNLQYKVVCALLYTHATSLLLLLSAAPIEFAHNGAKKLKKEILQLVLSGMEWSEE